MQKALSAALTIFLLFVPNLAAQAHTEATTTSPASGETVGAGEQKIQISFTEEVLELADSTELAVSDPDGQMVKTECTGVDKLTIFTTVFLSKAGTHQVTWRTVAKDGHPVSGKFKFKVAADSLKPFSLPACAVGSETPTLTPTPTNSQSPKPVATVDDFNTLNQVLTGIGIVALVAALWYFLVGKKRTKD